MALRFFTVFFCIGFSLLARSQPVVSHIQLDTTGQKVIMDFLIEGNDVTKRHVILRELPITKGDTLYWSNLKAALEQSENNLMNTGLFNFVTVEPIQVDNESVLVNISVQERWYLYPIPIFEIAETNFNTWWQKKELRWLNYGIQVVHKNFRGLNQTIAMTLQFGYTKIFSFRYAFPNLNRQQTLGLDLAARYYENEEIVYATAENKRLFYRNPEDKARRYFQYKVGLQYRENLYSRHYLDLSFYDSYVNDTLAILQPDYFSDSLTHAQFLRLSYRIDHDRRDYKHYPLSGWRIVGTVKQDGLGILNPKGFNLFSTYLDFAQHIPLGGRFYFGYAARGKIDWNPNPPYYLLAGLGYSNFVRGYEFYVIDGTRYALAQSNFKYQILKPHRIDLPFIPTEKFNKTFIALYGNLFADAGYVYGPTYSKDNSLVNEYLYSIGAGIDVVTYYDRVARAEVSYNALGQFGFYVHFSKAF